MERNEIKKAPFILDFGVDEWEAVKKLESILCTTPWNRHLNIYDNLPSETKLLIEMLIERAIVIGEVYYTPTEITEDTRKKARNYLMYLHKREIDYNLLNMVNCFSENEIDMSLTDKFALYYPHIKAYVRCGDLEPEKIFEFLQRDCCERVIIFNDAQPEANSLAEAFYSFEMNAPKAYILEKMAKLQEKKTEAFRLALEKIEIDNIIPDVKFLPPE